MARFPATFTPQPLYIEGGPNGPMIIAVTESNNVYALNPTTGTVIWQRNLGPGCLLSGLPCGNIDPLALPARPLSISPHDHFSSTQ